MDGNRIDETTLRNVYLSVAMSQIESMQMYSAEFRRLLTQISQPQFNLLDGGDDDGSIPISAPSGPRLSSSGMPLLPTMDRPFIG